MALKFQQPKQHNPKPAQPATKNPMLSELGFQSDEDSQGSGSDSDTEKDKNDEGDDKGGISFIEYLTLQKSLRKVTDEKIGLTDQLKEAREQLKKAEVQARRATTNSRMQVSVLQNAQKNQTDDLNNVIAHLKSLIEEIEEKGNNANLKDHGVRQLTDDATRLAAEKRQWFEKAELNEGMLSQLKEEMAEAEKEYEEKIEALKTELKETRQKVDPAAVARAQAAQGNSTFNNAEIEALRKETAELRAKLRDVEYNAAHAPPAASSHTTSSADTERFTEQIKELSSKNKDLKDELKDAHSQLAKLQAMSQSGSEKEQAQSKVYAELTEEANTLRKSNRDLTAKLEDISSKLRLEEQARQRAETEMTDLKSNLEKELKTIQGSAAAGEESKKSVETRLQQTAQELAAERAAHKAEQNAHASIKKELDTARAQIAAARADMEQKSNDHGAELQKERERAATALQNAKAQAAIEIAEVKQRSKDDMKELQERLDTFSDRVKPMVAVIKALSKDYRVLSKQSRDLQGEIAPAVKQCKRDLLRTLADIDTQYKEMITKYRKEMTLRKKLHNELVDLKGAIRVFARVRPLIKEDGSGPDSKSVTKFDNNDENLLIVESKGKDMVFEADHVFRPDGKQEDVFNAARDLIVSVIDGYNVCIFAYGQTGSGKTFTMDGTDTHPGLNRRALKELFDVMEEKKVDWSFEIEVSVMEIYNETLIDLLGDPKAKLEIRHGKLGPFVPDLSMHPVRTPEEVRERFIEAQKNRKTATTKMNFSSSRSHAMLVVYVTGTNLSTGVQTKGKLNLIDLAGSERVAKSGALDDEVRLKEATSINKSLSSLGDVIHALGTKQKHVPYRNSMLTHLLQDSLGGQAKTLMVVQVSPVLKNVEETMCSLNFAMRVRAVELGGSKRQTESAEIASLKKRVMELERGQA